MEKEGNVLQHGRKGKTQGARDCRWMVRNGSLRVRGLGNVKFLDNLETTVLTSRYSLTMHSPKPKLTSVHSYTTLKSRIVLLG